MLSMSASRRAAHLFIPQRVDGIEGGGFARGVEAEENADGGAEEEGSDDGRGRDHHGPFGEDGEELRGSDADRDSDDAAE